MITIRTFWLLSFLSVWSFSSVAASHRNVIGVARNNEAEVQYIEHHQYFDSGEHWINYYSPDMTLIVEKKLRYTGLPYHPDIVQVDLLNDIEITIKASTNKLLVTKEESREISHWGFELTPDVIVDAGFDGYIRFAWESLSPGETEILEFAVAGQKRLIKMKLRDKGYEGDRRVFVIEPNNWLVRLIIPQIRLEYSAEKQLVRYEGLSNITTKKGAESTVVDIRFRQWNGQLPQQYEDIPPELLVGRL